MIITLILAFLKIGFLGFGGGYAMLSLIYAESAHLGLSAAQFADLNALDGLIPGPIAINSATYIGQLTAGFSGALAATLTVCVPSLVLCHFICISNIASKTTGGSAPFCVALSRPVPG